MIRSGVLAVLAFAATLFFVADVAADSVAEVALSDPARGWEVRNLSSVETWLASKAGESGNSDAEDGGISVPVLRAEAWLARRNGEGERALALLDRAIELAPDHPDLRVDRASFRSDRIEDSGPLKSLRIARDVRADLEHALDVAPDHVDALAALAAFHLRAPGIAGGDRQEAAALVARLGDLAPSRRLYREAIEFAEDERFADAVDRIARAISLQDRPRPNWQLRMGDWMRRLGRDEDALDAYEQALSVAPQHAGAMYAVGRIAAETGLAQEAGITALERFLELPRWPQDPESKLAWWQLGRIQTTLGCVEQAEAAFRRAIALDSRWREPRQSLQRLADVESSERSCGSDPGRASMQ